MLIGLRKESHFKKFHINVDLRWNNFIVWTLYLSKQKRSLKINKSYKSQEQASGYLVTSHIDLFLSYTSVPYGPYQQQGQSAQNLFSR